MDVLAAVDEGSCVDAVVVGGDGNVIMNGSA